MTAMYSYYLQFKSDKGCKHFGDPKTGEDFKTLLEAKQAIPEYTIKHNIPPIGRFKVITRVHFRVYTNHHIRSFLTETDVPQETLDWYDWLDEQDKTYGWIHYKNHWYHVSDFTRIKADSGYWAAGRWDGVRPDSFFSGVVIKLIDDIDGDYIIGTYIG